MGLLDWLMGEGAGRKPVPAREPVINRYPVAAPAPTVTVNGVPVVNAPLPDVAEPRYAPLPPQAWPSQKEVDEARDYKRRFGNSNEQAIEAGLLQQTLPADTAARNTTLAGLAPGLLAAAPKAPLDRQTADQLYANQIAAQQHPLGYLGYDASKIVPTTSSDAGPPVLIGKSAPGSFAGQMLGQYRPDEDRVWSDQRGQQSTPVHESVHRAVEMLRKGGNLKIAHDEEELLVRAIMLKYHGDTEAPPRGTTNPQIEEARKRLADPKYQRYIRQVEQFASDEDRPPQHGKGTAVMLTRDDLDQIADWLKGPVLPKLVEQIEERYSATWKAATKAEDREHCWRMIKCLHGLVDEMNRLSAAPKVEQHNTGRARANNWTMPRPEARS